LRGIAGQELARGLDILARRYGCLPHELLDTDDVDFAFDWEVATRAIANEDKGGQ
jgi:hypothetical protein